MPAAEPSPPAWAVHLPPGVAPDRVDLLAGSSLPGRWVARWAERPQAPTLRDVDGRWLTAAELEARTRATAGRLRAGGLAPGERLVIVAESSAAFVVAYIAALRAGLTVVPVNPAYRAAEVRAIVAAAGPAAALAGDDERAGW